MDIKKEGPVDVVASHLSKVGLVPAETPKWVIMKKLFTPRSSHLVSKIVMCGQLDEQDLKTFFRKVLLTTHEGAPLSYRGA